jgi:hypothetical protein
MKLSAVRDGKTDLISKTVFLGFMAA